jgi:predicted transcriptional regulator
LLKAHEAKREKTARNEVSDDFMTVEEISLARGMSKSTVREWLKRCVKVGLVKIGMKRMPRIGGGTYPVAAYRFNDSAKEMK